MSVHLSTFPIYRPDLRDEDLEKDMALIRQIAQMGHKLRKEHGHKTRQPLPTLHIWTDRPGLSRLGGMLLDELNVKEVVFHLRKCPQTTKNLST